MEEVERKEQILSFSNLKDATVAFCRAAGNGNGHHPKWLSSMIQTTDQEVTPDLVVDWIRSLERRDDDARTVAKIRGRPQKRYKRFGFEHEPADQIAVVVWVCDSRPKMGCESSRETDEPTVVKLYFADNTVRISGRYLSVVHRIAAAKGESAPQAWRRAADLLTEKEQDV